ncbi:MAG: 30S ribosomal protein S12 methylthiotransferase RimO [Bacteroidota bacterium]|nr:30S ribosomal protein S12 methylthiotransferase RimO [Bacteroidota bacterium]
MKDRKVIHFVTLGCSKNLVDSEHLMKQIELSGYKVTHNSDKISSGTVIVNTCGFIRDAKQESIDTILELAQAKIDGRIQGLYVMGCLSQLYKDELKNEIPEVDQFFGVNNFEEILKDIGIGYNRELLNERIQTTPKHFAYLKISEGCDRTCAFCSIPTIRGRHTSISIEILKAEAQKLADQGVKELIVIAQDITYYGLDIYKEQRLAALLKELVTIKDLEWIRLHYAYPHKFPQDVIRVMKENPKICRYLDIPFQHISDKVLKQMKRGNNRSQAVELIQQLRQELPGIALRTTMLVGHPGETEQDFNELLEFVKETKFDRLGVFPYSHEDHSYAFDHYQDEIPDEIKEARVEAIMQLQQEISAEINHSKIGKTLRVIIDQKESEYWIGRTEFDSPEVDNEVLIPISTDLKIGRFYDVKIINANEYDLLGELSDEN